jgi:hypothetical protein
VFNCLYNNNSYGIGLHSQCRVLIERNYFVDTNYCIKQMYPLAEEEHHGFAEAVDNVFINTKGDMDDTGTSFAVNDYYMYNFVLDPADEVQSIVQSGAGPAEAYATIGLMPIPGQGAVGVDSSTLSWKTGTQSANSYVVYFGTSTNPPQVGTTSETSYDAGELGDGVVYYWRVDQVTSSGTIEGKLWAFRAEGAGEETDTETEDDDTAAEDGDTETEDDDTDAGDDDAVPSGPSADYAYCSDEGETCTYTGTVDIAYGADGEFNYLYNQSSGSIACDNSAFGDPISGVAKACYVKPALGDGDTEAEDDDTAAEEGDTEAEDEDTAADEEDTGAEDEDTETEEEDAEAEDDDDDEDAEGDDTKTEDGDTEAEDETVDDVVDAVDSTQSTNCFINTISVLQD